MSVQIKSGIILVLMLALCGLSLAGCQQANLQPLQPGSVVGAAQAPTEKLVTNEPKHVAVLVLQGGREADRFVREVGGSGPFHSDRGIIMLHHKLQRGELPAASGEFTLYLRSDTEVYWERPGQLDSRGHFYAVVPTGTTYVEDVSLCFTSSWPLSHQLLSPGFLKEGEHGMCTPDYGLGEYWGKGRGGSKRDAYAVNAVKKAGGG